VPDGLMFRAEVPFEELPDVAGLSGWWVDEALFPLGLEVNGLKLTLPKGAAPKIPKGWTEYDYSGDNPSTATLAYTAKTGIFKGAFKLYYDGWNAKEKFQHKVINVPYTGVMIPDGSGGLLGFGAGNLVIDKIPFGAPFGVPVFLD